MRIGISLSENAYTPEAYAYKYFLERNNHKIQFDYTLYPDNDINIYFMGVLPFWKEKKTVEIHEYQSLSVPPYGIFKDYIKKYINRKPDGRIFLNENVAKGLSFKDDRPYIYRDMGVDELFFNTTKKNNPEFDIVYSGSTNRNGLKEVLSILSKKNKILIIGHVSDEMYNLLKNKVSFAGRIPRNEIPGLMSNAKYGLNFTPDIYPFNIQTSTKVLEYLALGLPILSNKYKWIKQFSEGNNFIPIWFDEKTVANFDTNKFSNESSFTISREFYSWENVLIRSKFLEFLTGFVDYYS